MLALAAGASVWQDMSSAPAMLAPFVALTFGNAEWLGVRLMASGLGTGADVSTPSGSIRIERSMASVGLVRLFRPQRVVQPIVSVAAGIHYLFAQGASPTLPAHNSSAISGLASASGGTAVALGQRLSLVVELEVLFYWPSDIIMANGADAVRFDRPTLFAHAGLLASF